jgi:pSer/pThr/pTyr-binding forkhead associated (FHA) protein
VFGRLVGCEVVLDDAGVSREHAELESIRGVVWVRDLGSRNGTWVNGEPVERRQLRPGDRIGIGPDVIVELLADAAEAREPGRGAPDESPARRPARGDSPGSGPPGRARREESEAGSGGGAPSWFVRVDWILEPRAMNQPSVRLGHGATTVGRDTAAGLVLDDESVSRIHARFDAGDGQLMVSDLKSRNGTYMNDEPVLRARLQPDDEVRFGDVAFRVSRKRGPAWAHLSLLAGAALAVALVVTGVLWWGDRADEARRIRVTTDRMRSQALEDTQRGIAASADGDAEMARAYLLHAADLLMLSDLAPRGSSLQQPREVFREVLPLLPETSREFDFARALDPAAIDASEARLATLTNREYIAHQLKRYSVELGQDPLVPQGFVDQVNGYVEGHEKYPNSMRAMLRRARDLQPRLRSMLASRHLPEAFCFVAWHESGLDPMSRSPVGALGLWQLMPATARELGLAVNESDPARDQRTDVDRSTLAAADYLAKMLRAQGPEYFMLVLASYNRGPNALEAAKQKVVDPMLPATRKYWYLVEHDLLPEETRNYVPQILAIRLISEAPQRFGFEAP